MKFCPQCHGTTGDDEKHFCWLDGAKLVDFAKCQKCGRELNPMDNFCEYCGKPVERETDACHD